MINMNKTSFCIISDPSGLDISSIRDRPEWGDAHASFCVQMGDCVSDMASKEEGEAQIASLNSVFADIPVPTYHVIGNHDLHNFSLGEFMDGIGIESPSYSFDAGNYHIIILNSADGTTRGQVSHDQIEWLKKDLAITALDTVVLTHHLLGKYPRQRMLELNNCHLIKNHTTVKRILEDSGKVILVIEGHAHYRHTTQNGINYVCVGHWYTHHSLWNVSLDTEKINITETGQDGNVHEHISIPQKRNNAYYASSSSDTILSNVHDDMTSVLNVGCVSHSIQEMESQRSIGEWLHDRLESVANHVMGIDISEDGIEYMQEHGYDAEVMDAEEIDIGHKFDYIVAGFVVDHISNIGKFFEGCSRVCKDDGSLLITLKNPYAFVYLKHALSGRKRASDNIGLFTPDLLSNLAGRYGFVLDHLEFAKPRERGISKSLFSLGAKQFGGHVYLAEFKKRRHT